MQPGRRLGGALGAGKLPKEQPKTLLQQVFMPSPRTQPQGQLPRDKPQGVERALEVAAEPFPPGQFVAQRMRESQFGNIPLPGGKSVADLANWLFVPETKGDAALAVIPGGFTKKAGSIPLSRLKRTAMREGVPGAELTEALGKTIGDRLEPHKEGINRIANMWRDKSTGDKFTTSQLKEMFGEEPLVRADILDYRPKPKAESGTAPLYGEPEAQIRSAQSRIASEPYVPDELDFEFNLDLQDATTQELEAELARRPDLDDASLAIVQELEGRRPRGQSWVTQQMSDAEVEQELDRIFRGDPTLERRRQ